MKDLVKTAVSMVLLSAVALTSRGQEISSKTSTDTPNCHLKYVVSKLPNSTYQVAITDSPSNNKETFTPVFQEGAFTEQMKKALTKLKVPLPCQEKFIEQNTGDAYTQLLESILPVDNDAPMAGLIKIKRTPSVHKGDSTKPFSQRDSVILERGSIQFEDGFIQNISVTTSSKFTHMPLRYENEIAIPFSVRYDYNKLTEYKLFQFGDTSQKKYIRLSDLLRYEPVFAVGRRDYCPADTVIQFDFKRDIDEYPVFKLRAK